MTGEGKLGSNGIIAGLYGAGRKVLGYKTYFGSE